MAECSPGGPGSPAALCACGCGAPVVVERRRGGGHNKRFSSQACRQRFHDRTHAEERVGLRSALDQLRPSRRMAATSRAGAELDWHTDVALAHVAAWSAFTAPLAAPLSLVLVLVQVGARVGAVRRASGRAAVFTLVAILWGLHG